MRRASRSEFITEDGEQRRARKSKVFRRFARADVPEPREAPCPARTTRIAGPRNL